jgi:hypothetical protein
MESPALRWSFSYAGLDHLTGLIGPETIDLQGAKVSYVPKGLGAQSHPLRSDRPPLDDAVIFLMFFQKDAGGTPSA